jgi:hypothetical protein
MDDAVLSGSDVMAALACALIRADSGRLVHFGARVRDPVSCLEA